MNEPASASFPSLGTTAQIVVTDRKALDAARRVLVQELRSIDLACSRFRNDSELARVNRAGGAWTDISRGFEDAIRVGLRAARVTDGVVDPTLGESIESLGYDRDFDSIGLGGGRPIVSPKADWRCVELAPGRVRVPPGVKLDLGATAKALAADRAVVRAAASTRCGVLVNLGGDIAVAGPVPDGGWLVRISDDHRSPERPGDPSVAINAGGLATSSTTVRRWRRADGEAHHIVDPITGGSAREFWRTVSVAARTCVDANTASTAAIVLGPAAVAWLAGNLLPARLVRADGRVLTVGSWPAEAA